MLFCFGVLSSASGVDIAGAVAGVFCVCFAVVCLFSLIWVCYCCMVISCCVLG